MTPEMEPFDNIVARERQEATQKAAKAEAARQSEQQAAANYAAEHGAMLAEAKAVAGQLLREGKTGKQMEVEIYATRPNKILFPNRALAQHKARQTRRMWSLGSLFWGKVGEAGESYGDNIYRLVYLDQAGDLWMRRGGRWDERPQVAPMERPYSPSAVRSALARLLLD